MQTSANGRAFIEAFEGKFLKTYDDGTGVLTIGYGHTSAAGPPAVVRGQTITEAQCDAILANDLAAVEKNIERLIKVPMSQGQFDALVSFDFNTGSLGKGSIDDKINAGNPVGAMNTLLQYDHAGGRQMAGLTRRRQAERLMFTEQVAQALKLAGAHAAAPGGPMPQAPTKADPPKPIPLQPANGTVIPRDPTGIDVPPTVPKPPVSTATKVGTGAVIIGSAGGAVVAASQGFDWPAIGLSAFIVAGLVTVVVLLIRKFK